MSKSATDEYVRVMRNRYQAMRTKRAKGSVLDDFCQTSGYERKQMAPQDRSQCKQPEGRSAAARNGLGYARARLA